MLLSVTLYRSIIVPQNSYHLCLITQKYILQRVVGDIRICGWTDLYFKNIFSPFFYRELLLDNYNFLQYINLCPVLVAIGIFASTLSAALSALIGASRVLIALANDSLFGEYNVVVAFTHACMQSCDTPVPWQPSSIATWNTIMLELALITITYKDNAWFISCLTLDKPL